MTLIDYLERNHAGHREITRQHLVELMDGDLAELFKTADGLAEGFAAMVEFSNAVAYAIGSIASVKYGDKMGPGDAHFLVETAGSSLAAGIMDKVIEFDTLSGDTSPQVLLGWLSLNMQIQQRVAKLKEGRKGGKAS